MRRFSDQALLDLIRIRNELNCLAPARISAYQEPPSEERLFGLAGQAETHPSNLIGLTPA